MKTFVNLCKKPLLIVSAVLTAALLVLLVLSYTVPFGKTYKGTTERTDEGVKYTTVTTITRGSEKVKVKMTTSFDEAALRKSLKDEYPEMTDAQLDAQLAEIKANIKKYYDIEDEYFYVVKDGKVYVDVMKTAKSAKDVSTEEENVFAVVKGYKFVSETKENGKVVETTEYVCTANFAVQVTSIVFFVLFALATAGCVTVLVLDKKGVIKTEKAAA